MPATIADVMTAEPQTLDASQPVLEAALLMRDQNVGDVIVMDGRRLTGIATDRDIVVRVLAEGLGPDTPIGVACSSVLRTLSPGEPVGRAVEVMREHAIRRVPVVEGDQLVGIVSLGDLAVDRDPHSALGGISEADPNP